MLYWYKYGWFSVMYQLSVSPLPAWCQTWTFILSTWNCKPNAWTTRVSRSDKYSWAYMDALVLAVKRPSRASKPRTNLGSRFYKHHIHAFRFLLVSENRENDCLGIIAFDNRAHLSRVSFLWSAIILIHVYMYHINMWNKINYPMQVWRKLIKQFVFVTNMLIKRNL